MSAFVFHVLFAVYHSVQKCLESLLDIKCLRGGPCIACRFYFIRAVSTQDISLYIYPSHRATPPSTAKKYQKKRTDKEPCFFFFLTRKHFAIVKIFLALGST